MLIVFVTNDFKIGILFHCSKIDILNVLINHHEVQHEHGKT